MSSRRSDRRNIVIANDEVNDYLDQQQNVSKFLTNLVVEHMAKIEGTDLLMANVEAMKIQVDELEKKYLQMLWLLDSLSKALKED